MAYYFTREDPVLNFGPRKSKEHANRISWEYILWPAWAYRVVAPRVRDREFNMFQRAILGLARAGLHTADAISIKLGIHRDLVALILLELANRGYVDQDGCPTDQGIQAVIDDSIEAHDLVVGYVFQDPWNGELWPRFVEQLNYCDLEFDESGFPKLILGSKGKPRRQGAFMVLPGDAPFLMRPSPASIIAAVSGQRKGMRYADNLVDWEDELRETDYSLSAIHINRVSFVEEEPAPVFLMTYLYLTNDSGGNTDWYACDPFGLGCSVWLRRRVEYVVQTIPPFFELINRMVGRGVQEGIQDQKQWVEQLKISATLEVERRLNVNFRSHPAFNHVVNMEFERQEVALLGHDCPESKLHTTLRICLKVMESMFASITDRFPLDDIWKRVYAARTKTQTGEIYYVPQQDRKWVEATFQTAASSIGFQDPMPEAMLGVKPGHIRSVAEYKEYWRLRPLVMATIMAAQLTPNHPLWVAAKINSRLIHDVEEIARQGGRAGHANEVMVTLDEVDRTVELAYAVISVLLGFGSGDIQNPVRRSEVANV